MTHAAASPRFVGAFGALALSISVLAACAPTPEPTPTPTALFASDEEAFAAAEETYEAYLDALNGVDLTAPESFEAVYDWTTGSASASIRESLSKLHAEGFQMTGDTVLQSVTPVSANTATGEISMRLCADVSDTDIVDTEGNSVVAGDRADVQALAVSFTPAGTRTGLTISSSTGDETLSCSP